jgi:hypothetical protein
VIDASKDRNNIQLPDLSQVINKTRISENTATNADTTQENKSADANNKDWNLTVKPVLPKETKKNVESVVKNIQPEANAGKNQIVVEGSQVILDGSKSKDRDGKIESYHWQQIIGPSIALDNVNDIKMSFISPAVNQDTKMVFKLTVTDDKGSSDSAITAVKVVRNEEVRAVSPSDIPDSSTSNIQNSSNMIQDVGNSTIERIRP